MPYDDETKDAGTPLVEPDQDVRPWRIRYGADGRGVLGPQPVDIPITDNEGKSSTKTIREIYSTPIPGRPFESAPYIPGQPHSFDDFVLTPEEFRAGYRLNTPVGPPVIPELTEALAAQVSAIVDYIDETMPKTAARLKLSPHLIFTVPELAAAVSNEITDSVGIDSSAGVASVVEALTEGGDHVFSAPSIENVLAATEVTSTFWQQWGEFFQPEQRDIVATLLATTPIEWRDRVAGLAYRYVDENRDSLATSPEAMDNFIVWLWQEVRRQQESVAFTDSGFGNFMDKVSQPYYWAQEQITKIYNNIVAPEDVAWRNALTPGQTVAISVGADPSEDGWTWKSGVIDFFGTFLWDPVNVVGGVGMGYKTARSFPIAAKAADETRLWRAAKTVVPLFGRRNANNLPVGARSAWQRLGFHLFAKDAEDLVGLQRFQPLYQEIADHWVAHPNDYAGLVEKFPQLRPLLGEKGGGLVKINSTDPKLVKEGFLNLLTQQSDTTVSTVKAAEETVAGIGRKLKEAQDLAFQRGSIGLDDLTDMDYVAAGGVKVIDAPFADTRHVMVTAPTGKASADAARLIWTEEPRIMQLADEATKGYFAEFLMIGGKSADEAAIDVAYPQTLSLFRGDDYIEITATSTRGTAVGEEFDNLPQVEELITIDLAGKAKRGRVVTSDEDLIKIAGDDRPHNWTRRVRIQIDPESPLASIPEEINGPLRMALYGAIPEQFSDDEAIQMVDDILKAALINGTETVESVAKRNNAKGLPVLYTGMGALAGTEGVQTARTGYKSRARLFLSPDAVRAAGFGETPIDITEPFAFIFQDALPTVTSPSLAYGGFDDLGRQGTSLKPPTEFILYTGRGEPKLINLANSNEFTRELVRGQFQFFFEPQQKDLYQEGWDAYVRNFVSPDDIVDDIRRNVSRFLPDDANATEAEITQAYVRAFDDAVTERASLAIEDELVPDFVARYEAQLGRQPTAEEVEAIKEDFRLAIAREIGHQRDEVARTLKGGITAPDERAIEINFRATEDALFGDVVPTEDAEGVAQIYRTKIRRTMFIQDQLDELVRKAEEGGWSDAVLLHELYGTMVSAGIEGRKINRTMRHIERQFAKNYDGAILPRGGLAPRGPLGPAERRRQLLEWRRERFAEIDKSFGLGEDGKQLSDLTDIQAKKRTAMLEAVDRQMTLQSQVDNAGPDPMYLWFNKSSGKKNTYTVRPGYAKDEMHLALTVPADARTRAAMLRLYQSEVFLDLPPNVQSEVLNRLPRHDYFGLGVGPEGSLDIPAEGRNFDEMINEAGNIKITGGTLQEDTPGFEAVRPRELGDFGDVNLEDPFRGPTAPQSLDAPVAGTEGVALGDTVADPTAEAAFAAVEGAPPAAAQNVPPQTEAAAQQLALPFDGMEAPEPRNLPPFAQDDIDVLLNIAEGKGYDAVQLPGGYQVLTRKGMGKSRMVKVGKGSGELDREIADLQKQLIKAQTELTWAKAGKDNRFTALKSMPKRSSISLGNMMMDLPRKMGISADLDSHLARTVRRFKAGWSDTYPEGIDITNTNVGYGQLRSFMKHMGVRPSTMQKHLNDYVNTPVSQRWGLISDIIDDVAQEIDHPIMRATLQDWSSTGGMQSYSPTVINGELRERTLRAARTRPGFATSPARPSQLSRIYPMPTPDFYKMLTRYRKGKALPSRVKFLSTLGGTKTNRIASGRRLVERLQKVDPETFANLTDEEALILGYANITDPDTISRLAQATRASVGGAWRWAHKAFTRVQLAARPVTWFFRVVVFDEMTRGALFDAPSLYRHPLEWFATTLDNYKLAQNENYLATYVKVVNDELIQMFTGVNDVNQALRRADDVIPEFRRVATELGFGDFQNADQVENALFQALRLDLDPVKNYGVNLDNFGSRMKKFRRKALSNQKRLSKYELPPDFSVDDLVEISQKGLTNAVMKNAEATFQPMEWAPNQMNSTQRKLYGRGYGQQFHGYVTDPWGRITLKALASEEAGAKSSAVYDLINDTYWPYMRREIIDVADFNGVEWGSDAELAAYWLDNVLMPEARDLLTPLFGDDLRTGAMSVLSGRATAKIRGSDYPLKINKNSPASIIDTFENMVASNPGHAFPPRVAASFDIRYALANSDRNLLVKIADNIIEAFGEQTTQALNRRPAWIRTYRDEMRYLRTRGLGRADGFTEAENIKREWVIRRMAETAANQRVNHIYFNLKDVPHYVQQMNKVIPFFSAFYEVTTSWAFKVPFAMAPLGWPSGVAVLGRKVDRFMQGLIRSGLLEVEDEVDENSVTNSRQLSLRISSDLPSNVQAAEYASKGLMALMKGPELITRWIGSLTSAVDMKDVPFPDVEYRLGIGNPLDPGSHGYGASLQLSAGLNPVGSALLGSIRNRTSWGADVKKFDATEDMTLADLAEQQGVSVQQLLNWNSDLFVKLGVFTQLDINEHMRGLRKLDQTPLGRDVSLRVPNSTVLGDILDEVFFPFDQVESGVGVLNGFVPSWGNFFMRGWGLHNAVGEDAPWEMTDDGEIIFDFDESSGFGGIANMWVNVMVPPETRTFMAGNITQALQHLEATEGVITSQFELVNEYNRLQQDALDAGLRGIVGENGRFEPLQTDDPRLREMGNQLLALQTQIANHNSMIVKRATEIAAFSGFTRGLAGLLGPANPRVVYEDAEARALYYNSRDAVDDARLSGSDLAGVQLPEIRGVTDAKAFFQLADLWLQDSSGDAAKTWFRETFPEVQPFLQGKTYWGAGGEPIESQSYTQYVDQIRSGERRPYPPEVAIVLQMLTAASIERETRIVERYGNDPLIAARSILSNTFEYKEIQSEYQLQRDYIDMLDDQIFGGKYQEFADRELGEFPVFQDNIYKIFDDALKDIELAEEALATNALLDDSIDLRNVAEDLRAAASGVRNVRREFETQDYNYARNPREEIVTQYYDNVMAPFWDKQAEFYDRIGQPGVSSEDRSRIFTEMRAWENQLMLTPVYVQGRDGSQVIVPNPLEFRARSNSPEEQQRYVNRNLISNPRWNNLFDNRQMAAFYPALNQFLPTEYSDMQRYDAYDMQLNDIYQAWERDEITTKQKDEAVDLLSENFRQELRINGKPNEEFFMLDATPAERLAHAGMLSEWPTLLSYAANIRKVMDAAVAAGESPIGQYVMPTYKAMLSDMKRKWTEDPMWRERFIQWTRDLGYEQVFLDEFFNEFFLGKFNGDL